ncbi:hypothetical protein Tco_0554786 [Tanacetum coccineum]
MNQVLNENERLLEQVINKDIVNIIMNSTMDNASVIVYECEKCLKLKTELLNKKDLIKKETYDRLFRSFTTLKKHCISLEVDTQLNQEIFQRDNSVSNQSAPNFDQYFKLNELKAQFQEKDKDLRMSKLIAENEHLKQTYKQLYDSIKPTCIRSKEQCDALISQVNQKSVEISDLNEQATILSWRPTGRTFTIVGNACPLTRITITAEVPLRKPNAPESDTPKPVVTLVYTRKPRKSKTNVPVSKTKIIKSIPANKKEPSKS